VHQDLGAMKNIIQKTATKRNWKRTAPENREPPATECPEYDQR